MRGSSGSAARVAYDLSAFDGRSRVREAAAAMPYPDVRTAPKTRAKAKSRARAASPITLFAIIGFLALGSLFVTIIYSYAELTELGIETARLKTQAEELTSEQASLSTQLEQRISLAEVEERALQLGMHKPSRDQIVYMDTAGGERAEVLVPVQAHSQLFSGLGDLIGRITDFFG